MFAGETPFIRSELEALRAQPDWEDRWLPAIQDSGIGGAPRMSGEPSTNANMVHQAFHLMMWNKATAPEEAAAAPKALSWSSVGGTANPSTTGMRSGVILPIQ